MFRTTGLRSFYFGLDSALLRQVTYTTTRFGIFLNLTDYLKSRKEPGQGLSFAERAFSSLCAGGIGAVVGNPADLSLIRMQTDGTLPEAERRNYKSVGDTLTRIVREEGFFSLWKGCSPTVIRAMALNFGMLTFFGFSKEKIASIRG